MKKLSKINRKALSSLIFVIVVSVLIPLSVLAEPEAAYEHLTEVMDRYHNAFDVYTDRDAGGNHFNDQQWFNGDQNMEVNTDWADNPHSGHSCIRVHWNGERGDDGWLWNGVMMQAEGPGRDLDQAETLTFWARTEELGLRVIFLINPAHEDERRWIIELNENWSEIVLDVAEMNLDNLENGFGFVFDDRRDPDPNGTTFYLDDIKYNHPQEQRENRLNEPRFLLSYNALVVDNDREWAFNQAYTYDNALSMLAFLARGTDDDMRRARLIGEAFVFAQGNDRFFDDGRLRNAYRSGYIEGNGNVRLPGWWDDEAGDWFEDKYQVSTYTGEMAWVIIAWLAYDRAAGENRFRDSAERLGGWIFNNHWVGDGDFPGYAGGFEGNDDEAQALDWKSTEHNIDVFAAFTLLFQTTENEVWQQRAEGAKRFVESMWNEESENFWTGTTANDEINEFSPLDANPWALLVFQDIEDFDIDNLSEGMQWAQENCFVEFEEAGWEGFHFCATEDIEDQEEVGVWWEGTAQMCTGYQMLSDFDNSGRFLDQLRRWQAEADATNDHGVVACFPDRIFTGIWRDFDNDGEVEEWFYYHRLHIGATAWYIFAERQHNPYWQTPTNAPPSIENPIEDVEVDEDSGMMEIEDLDNVFNDPDVDELQFIIEGIDELNLALNNENILTIEPEANYNGASQVNITATDGWHEARDVFVVTVNPINDAPQWIVLPEGWIVAVAGEVIEFNLEAIDVDNEELEIELEGNLPEVIEFVDNGDGSAFFRWETELDDAGEYLALFKVSDGELTDEFEVNIEIEMEQRDIIVELEEGWNLISINVSPDNEMYAEDEDRGPDIIRMTDQLRIDEENHHLLLMKNEAGQFYVPAFNAFNNIPYWNLAEGYLIKVDEDVEAVWEGESIPADADIELTEGWNMIAYFPTYELDAGAPDFYVLSPIIDNVDIAKDGEGRFLLPEFNFSNMNPWCETRGYQVKVDADVTLNYPQEQDQIAFLDSRTNQTQLVHWAKNTRTNENMSLLISDIQGVKITEGAQVAALDKRGAAVGVDWIQADGRCGLAIWGGDYTTEPKEGLKEGESFTLRLWDSVRNIELLLIPAAFHQGSSLSYQTDALIVIDVVAEAPLPAAFSFSEAYPNPFNVSTRLTYGLPEACEVSLKVYDLSGRLSTTLINGKREAGYHSKVWNANDYASGLYLVRLKAEDWNGVRKILLVK